MPMQSWHYVNSMRMRKVKWAVDYLSEAKCLIRQPEDFKGKWKETLDTSILHVEIGCGKGNYSLEMSKLYPDEGFIAIEKNDTAAGMAAKKYDDDQDLGKLVLIQNDAQLLNEWFGKDEIDIIHLNFSDPWPKKRYAKRRLSSQKFLDQYKEVLSPAGQVIMKTDNPDLFSFSLIEFQNAGFTMKEIDVNYRRQEHKEDAMTEYEEKFVSKNMPIYRCVWQIGG